MKGPTCEIYYNFFRDSASFMLLGITFFNTMCCIKINRSITFSVPSKTTTHHVLTFLGYWTHPTLWYLNRNPSSYEHFHLKYIHLLKGWSVYPFCWRRLFWKGGGYLSLVPFDPHLLQGFEQLSFFVVLPLLFGCNLYLFSS